MGDVKVECKNHECDEIRCDPIYGAIRLDWVADEIRCDWLGRRLDRADEIR